MGKRLILFTGGIESTAMLANSFVGDIALTLYDRGEPDPLFNMDAARAIAKLLNRRHIVGWMDVGIVRDRSHTVFQLFHLMAGASMFVSKDPSITEVWFGLNSAEPAPMWVVIVRRMIEGWKLLHPDVPFHSPLIAYSAREQWDMIPEHVQPLVRNCLHDTQCGTCRKCLKLKTMPGSLWNPKEEPSG